MAPGGTKQTPRCKHKTNTEQHRLILTPSQHAHHKTIGERRHREGSKEEEDVTIRDPRVVDPEGPGQREDGRPRPCPPGTVPRAPGQPPPWQSSHPPPALPAAAEPVRLTGTAAAGPPLGDGITNPELLAITPSMSSNPLAINPPHPPSLSPEAPPHSPPPPPHPPPPPAPPP